MLLFLTLDLSNISTSDIKERKSYIQKAIDKSVIEAGKSQKYLHVYTTV